MNEPQSNLRRFVFADERTLLAAVLRREPRAWAELVRRYEPPVRRAIARILAAHVTDVDARDAVREVVANVYLGLLEQDLAQLRVMYSDAAIGAGLLGDQLGRWATRVTWAWVHATARQPVPMGDAVLAPAPVRGARWIAHGL
jgi:hypothetical protein